MMSFYKISLKNSKQMVLMTALCLLCVSHTIAQVTYNKRAGGQIGEAPKIGNFSTNYGLDNVERSTGTVNINIPLYEIKAHDITVPISISYSALGIKIGQEAGAPGMGWELNAGGKINRQVNGLIDNNSSPGIKSTSPINLNADMNPNDRNTLMGVMNGTIDYAYDTYSYTVPGGGGRFTEGGLTFPYDPTFKYDPETRKITTGDGLVHAFTNGDLNIIRKRKFYRERAGTHELEEIDEAQQWGQDVRTVTSDYNLTMITSNKTRDTVKFEYQDTMSINSSFGIYAKDRITTTEMLGLNRQMIYKADNTWGDANGKYYFISEPVIGQTKVETLRHSRLKRITYSNGKVEFEYNPVDVLGRDVLTKVTVYQKDINGNYKWLKHYQFNYDPDVQYGHYLEYIDVFDAASAKVGKWKFKYHGALFAGDMGKLPVRPDIGSKAQDRWGFFNGKTTNKTLIENPDSLINLRDIPHLMSCFKEYPGAKPVSFNYRRSEAKIFYNTPGDFISSNVGFADRSTNFNEMLKGTLTSVTSPTGEVVEYEYEPNKYQIIGTNDAGYNYTKVYLGGGIRIKSITRIDGAMFSGQLLSKKGFTYGVGTALNPERTEIGFGVVNIPGVVTSVVCNYVFNYSTTYKENLQVLSHPLNDLALHKGSAAYYPSVTESTYSGPNIKHQTTYYYNGEIEVGNWNFPTPSSIEQLNFVEFYTNMGIKRDRPVGVPEEIIEFNGTRLGNTKARITKNGYSEFRAPSTTPKFYSFFGGVKGTKIGQYTTTFTVCSSTNNGGNYTFECVQIATIPNMDPLGYKDSGPEFADSYYQGKYYGFSEELSAYSNVYKLTSTTTTTFNTIYVDNIVNTTKYAYANKAHMQPTMITSFNSNSDSTATRIKYAHDFLQNTVPGVNLLRDANMRKTPVEQLSMVKKDGSYKILGGVLNTFMSSSGLVVNSDIFGFNTEGKLVAESNTTEADSKYKLESSYLTYDNMGNPILYTNLKGPKTALVWGYDQQYPIAEIVNAQTINDVAFTNFERSDKGGWIFSGSNILDDTSPAQDHVYPLASGSITKTYTTTGKKYLVSYWLKYGSSVIISGGTVGPEIVKRTVGNWSFAEREVVASGNMIISGTGYIDELRFCPADAMMQTFNYNPGIGLISSLDSKGKSVTYEYDNEQRTKYVKDQDGNIVKAYDYNLGKKYRQ